MGFAQELSSRVRKHLSNLKRLHDKRVDRATEKARRQLATAKTKTEKEKIKLQLQRDKMSAKRELYEAQIATQKAKKALEVARKEAGDLTFRERISRGVKLTWGALTAPPRKRTTRPKTTKKVRKARVKTRAKTLRT